MPSGDPQRVWFPEMLEELKKAWSRTMSWEEMTDLCARMTKKREQIRKERAIQAPKTRCSKCGRTSRSDITGVSIRSALFALKKSGLFTDSELKELDKSWMKHRKAQGLDAHGRRTAPESAGERGPRECGDRHGAR